MDAKLLQELPRWSAADDSQGQLQAAELLRSIVNLRERVSKYLASLSALEFAAKLQPPTGPGGQWLLQVFDDGVEGLQVWLSYFRLESFSRLLRLKQIVPHRHQRSFAARIITGSYVEWTYTVEDNAILRFKQQNNLRAGDVYTTDYRDVHLVLKPSLGCLSLAIRGPEMYSAPARRMAKLDWDIEPDEIWREISVAVASNVGEVDGKP